VGCPACKHLKASMNAGGEFTETIKDLADDFNMVSAGAYTRPLFGLT